MASWLQKTLLTAESLTGFVGGMYKLLRRRATPRRSGTLALRGLHQMVKIVTDTYGVPHIYAHNEDDLYFGQGYVHAQERLWQMELNRRLGSGRLSELFGPVTLETDRFCRRLGMHRAALAEAEGLPVENRRMLEAYARGVNAYIQQHLSDLGVEFSLLNFRPEAWTPADTLQWGKVQGWSLSGNWESELIRARIVNKVGPEKAAKLEAGYDPTHPLIVPPGTSYQGVNIGLLEHYEQIKILSGFSVMGGSNNWVVDGTRSASGLPLLCNDPHLGQAIPSIWFECHLVAGDLDVTGASFPGSPGIIIGHNQHIAWGVTNAVSDVQDLYVEKFNPDNPHQYEFKGQWEEAEIIREEIRVKGQEQPVVEEVRVTRHGPILTRLAPVAQPQSQAGSAEVEIPLALRWTGLEPGTILTAVRGLNRASKWDEFCNALESWDVPPQNFVYADTQGNIGYIMAGAIPLRSHQQSLLPVPGWTGEYEWDGRIPFAELPQTYNPDQHYIVTANNRVIADDYRFYISHEWLNGYRAQRIADLITQTPKLTVADMAGIQSDQHSLPAEEFVQYMLALDPRTPTRRAAQEILRTWDYTLKPESIAASIYSTFVRKLEQIAISAILGDDEELLQNYLGSGISTLAILNGYASRSKPLLLRLLAAQDDQWFADSAIPNGPTSWSVALDRAFDATLEELRTKFGNNILHWQYGAIHKMTYNHPLGAVKALEPYLNRGPYPAGGDSDTINMGNVSPSKPEAVVVVPSYRQIIDLGDLAGSQSIHAPGQSGHPGDKHYDDFIGLWRAGKYHPQLYTEEQVRQGAEETLYLMPQSQLPLKIASESK